jgi:UDP-GlcNAc:undecaprenyl-phosphate GlcNAc-1-phosphate transferase
VLTPLALRAALRWQAVDEPGERKVQQQAVPYLGGVAIVLAFSVTVLAAAGARAAQGEPPARNSAPWPSCSPPGCSWRSWVWLTTCGGERRLPAAGRGGCRGRRGVSGSGATLIGNPLLDGVATVVWVVLIVNAFNLLDNMDGLSAGVAAIASGTFFVLAVTQGSSSCARCPALDGCASVSCGHNFHGEDLQWATPGSLFLGFLLALMSTRHELVDSRPWWPCSCRLLVLCDWH